MAARIPAAAAVTFAPAAPQPMAPYRRMPLQRLCTGPTVVDLARADPALTMRRHVVCLACAAWSLLAWVIIQPVAGRAQEASTEILNFTEAPFELLSGPDDDNASSWGGILNLSFFVRNTSTTTLYSVTVRFEEFNAANPFPGPNEGWHVWRIDLGRPDGLEPGEKTYVLNTLAWGLCSPFTAGRGRGRFILMPEAAEGFRSFAWRKAHTRASRPMPLQSGATPRLIATARIDQADRPLGTSACASLRQQALAGCPLGFDDFECIAPLQGDPQVVERRCADFDVLGRWAQQRKNPDWCRTWK